MPLLSNARVPRPPRPIGSWILLVALGLIGLGIGVVYEWQSSPVERLMADGEQVSDLEVTKLQVEVIRNSLAVGAGIGALAALILGFRRQQHAEYDSAQQRITELRIKAVEQLGSDNSTIRIGGLHNLERLGEQHKELRQVIIDEICSYLRLPFAPPPETSTSTRSRDNCQFEPIGPPPAEVTDEASQELQVRLIAQEILQRHLNHKDFKRDYWKHSHLNLKGAFLDHIDLFSCVLYRADFSGAEFHDPADFSGAKFHSWADFSGAKFHSWADFSGAIFHLPADFSSAEFDIIVDPYMEEDHGGVDFSSAKFHGRADFNGAEFHDPADYRGAEFHGSVGFIGAEFHGIANFGSAELHDNANFGSAKFQGSTNYGDAKFHGRAKLHIQMKHVRPAGYIFVPIPNHPGLSHLRRDSPDSDDHEPVSPGQ